jgi:CheY-like chemotaxis protein
VPAWYEMQQTDLLPMCRDVTPDPKAQDLYIYAAVADSGHGMTPEEQDRVFQRFAQASPRTYGEFGGHGLGLFVSCVRRPRARRARPLIDIRNSKMLVELHGGRIQLQSTQGAGTVLRFFIRVRRATTASSPAKSELIEFPLRGSFSANSSSMSEHDDALPARKMRVLVVEVRQPGLVALATASDPSLHTQDNLINQRCANISSPPSPLTCTISVLVKLLTILDCEAATCKDGQECVDLLCALATPPERASERRFDLILMDLEMYVSTSVLRAASGGFTALAGLCWTA